MVIRLMNFNASMNILFIDQNEDFLAHYMTIQVPPIMLIIEPRMVNLFWTSSPIPLKHMVFWVLVHNAAPNHKPLTWRYQDYCYVDLDMPTLDGAKTITLKHWAYY